MTEDAVSYETTHERPTLLYCSDAIVPSGFARVTSNILRHLLVTWDVHCLASGYLGDPHTEPYPCYPAHLSPHGDYYGVGRYAELVERFQPDVVLVNQNPQVVAAFAKEHTKLPAWPKAERPPLVAYIPVDGIGVSSAAEMDAVDVVVAYTRFGAEQILENGYHGPMTVIPHGVDVALYFPRDKAEAREHLGVPELNNPEALVIGNLNRNQPRKRLDATVLGFARWLQMTAWHGPAYLWLHCTDEDAGGALKPLARAVGIEDHVIWAPPALTTWQGADEAELPWLYSAWDIHLSTTLGEGWGLSTLESMACGVPNLVPCWSALAEWARGGVAYLRCTDQALIAHTGTLGGVVTSEAVAKALEVLVQDAPGRAKLAADGLALAQRPEFRWEAVAARLDAVLRLARAGRSYEVQVPERQEAEVGG